MRWTYGGAEVPRGTLWEDTRGLCHLRSQASGEDCHTSRVLVRQTAHLPHRRERPQVREPPRDQRGALEVRREGGARGGHPGPVPDPGQDMRKEEGGRDDRPLLRHRRQLLRVQLLPEVVHEPRPRIHQDDAGGLRQQQLRVRQVLLHPGPEADDVPGVQGLPP